MRVNCVKDLSAQLRHGIIRMIMGIPRLYDNGLLALLQHMTGMIIKETAAPRAKGHLAQPLHMTGQTIRGTADRAGNDHSVPHPHMIGQIILAIAVPCAKGHLAQPQHGILMNNRHNNRINPDWQIRCAPLPAGYAERWAEESLLSCKVGCARIFFA